MDSSEIPVGGRLKSFVKEWENITNDQWVLSVVKQESTRHRDKTGTCKCKRYTYFNGKIIAKRSNTGAFH